MTDVRPSPPVETPAPQAADLRQPGLYINRELSWLELNRRVLAEAQDPRNPALERLKFLSIFSSNLDEFFQVRVAGLKQQLAVGYAERTADGMTPEDQLRAISALVRDLQRDHGASLTGEVLPSLAAQGISLLSLDQVTEADREHISRYFRENVFPVLTPLAVDPAHPFPYISNLSLSIAVMLRDSDGEEHFARVKVPKILPRWVPLPGTTRFIPLEQVIGANLEALFPGIEILGWYMFRITRNTDIQIDQDEAEDLLSLIQEEIRNRRFGEVTRLEIQPGMPRSMRQLLIGEFAEEQESAVAWLTDDDVYEVAGPMDAADLMSLATLDIPELRDPPFTGVTPPRLAGGRNPFDVIREGDLLVHHPYDSFHNTVERVIQAAVDDPDVLAIKITLYRTGGDSSIARLLAQAAERGKQVAVLIELQARFDEESNIIWAQRLEDVGVHVSYGVAGLKTHAKVMLIVRREGDAITRYVHIGTGNYNPKTARLYTDFGLFSADPALGSDLTDLFNVLTGFAIRTDYRKLILAPSGMRDRFLWLIRREADHARHGRPARILAKMNALVDPEIIAALYEASRAGVPIQLIVRGICCLRPGLPGVSDHIEVISIIGRLLEHSRAFWFENDGWNEVYIGSGDWMPRNLDRRIEVTVPVETAAHRDTLRDLLELMWQDHRQAWELRASGSYFRRAAAPGEEARGTHQVLMDLYRQGR